tara:strand:+ start:4513 stop:4932 length:420 start_codon:yes stop_codon:yes gene_type:complete
MNWADDDNLSKPTGRKWFRSFLLSSYTLRFYVLISVDIKKANTPRIIVQAFLLVEISNEEMWLVSDNIENRSIIMKMENGADQLGYLTQLFSTMGYDVNIRNIRVTNLSDSLGVKEWVVDYHAFTDFNTRRIVLEKDSS